MQQSGEDDRKDANAFSPLERSGDNSPFAAIAGLWHPAMFWTPETILASAWREHIPFAFWLMATHRPQKFVELGTHTGASYFAFCQAVDRLALSTATYAVDTWQGDEHAGFYDESVYRSVVRISERKYGAFSNLLRMTFDEALPYFSDGGIDLLHIDGLHTYEAVKHDFDSWLPTLSGRAIVLFHDINVRRDKFGVYKFFGELAERYPSFQFLHGHGLGVIAVGEDLNEKMRLFFEMGKQQDAAQTMRLLFSNLGARCAQLLNIQELEAHAGRIQSEMEARGRYISEVEARLQERVAEGNAYHSERAAADSERERLATRIGEFEAELEGARVHVAEAEKRNNHLLTEAEALRAALVAVGKEKNQLAVRLDEVDSELRRIRSLVGELEARNTQLLIELDREHTARAAVEGERKRLIQQIDKAHSELADARAQVELLQRRTAELQSFAEREKAELGLKLNEINSCVRNAITSIQGCEDGLDEKLPLKELLERSMAAEKLKLDKAVSQRQEIQDGLHTLQEEVGRLKSALSVAQQEKEQLEKELLRNWKARTWSKFATRVTYGKAHPLFDHAWYLMAYEDVRKSRMDPWGHFMRFGLQEGRQPNAFFAPGWYLQQNADVDAGGMNPLKHYWNFGSHEGRDPHPEFKNDEYLSRHGDVAAAGINPLYHYIKHGRSEGREMRLTDEPMQLADREYEETRNEYLDLNDESFYPGEGAAFRTPFRLPGFILKRGADEKARIPSNFPPVLIAVVAVDELSARYSVERFRGITRDIDKIIVVGACGENLHSDVACVSVERFCSPDFIEEASKSCEYLIFSASNQRIKPAAMSDLLSVMKDKDAKFGYGDECYVSDGELGPFFKPEWDPVLLVSQDYIGQTAVVNIREAIRLGGFEAAWFPYLAERFALKNLDRLSDESVAHVSEILALSPFAGDKGVHPDTRLRKTMVRDIESVRQFLVHMRNPPKAEIIIPTRDGYDILKKCVESIKRKTIFNGDYQITIVDNQTTEDRAKKYLEECKRDGIKIIKFDEEFNYSKMNNVAVEDSTADCLVFLNNDIEVITATWLQRIVAAAILPDVGAVGAKLLYPDTRVQHAGVVLGPGHAAMHVLRLSKENDAGYAWQLAKTRSYLAVTAACLAVSRQKFMDVGGFNAVDLPVAYNDVDLCLKLYMSGYANVWFSNVKLFHHESISRGSDSSPEKRARAERELQYMWKTWKQLYDADPYHNNNILYNWGSEVSLRRVK